MQVNIDEVKSDWQKTAGPLHIRKIAEHYGIFEDLFGKYAYFVPRVFLDIKVVQKNKIQAVAISLHNF